MASLLGEFLFYWCTSLSRCASSLKTSVERDADQTHLRFWNNSGITWTRFIRHLLDGRKLDQGRHDRIMASDVLDDLGESNATLWGTIAENMNQHYTTCSRAEYCIHVWWTSMNIRPSAGVEFHGAAVVVAAADTRHTSRDAFPP